MCPLNLQRRRERERERSRRARSNVLGSIGPATREGRQVVTGLTLFVRLLPWSTSFSEFFLFCYDFNGAGACLLRVLLRHSTANRSSGRTSDDCTVYYVVCVVRTEYLLMSNLILCYQDVPYLKLNHELFRYEMLSFDQSQPRVVLLCRCGVGFRIPMAISVREEARSPFQAPWMRQASRGVSPQVTGLRPQSIRGQDFVPHRTGYLPSRFRSAQSAPLDSYLLLH